VNGSSEVKASAHETGKERKSAARSIVPPPPRGIRQVPRIFCNQNLYDMPKPITDKYGNLLKPIRIDRNTLLYVASKDATQARAEKFRKDADRSQKMTLNLV